MAYYGMTNKMDYKYSLAIVPNPIIRLSLMEREMKRENKDMSKWLDQKEIDLIKAFCREQDGGYGDDDCWLVEVKYYSDDKSLCDENGNCDGHPFPRYIPLWMLSGKTQGSEVLFELDSANDVAVRLRCDQTKYWGFDPSRYGMKTSENPDPQEYDPAWEVDPFQQEIYSAIFRRINNGQFYRIDMKEVFDDENEKQRQCSENMSKMFEGLSK